jgi:hypothetical protein
VQQVVLMVIQFFVGFLVYVVLQVGWWGLQVGWWWLKLPYETDPLGSDFVELNSGAAVTLGLFVLGQLVSYWGARRCLSIPSSPAMSGTNPAPPAPTQPILRRGDQHD